MWSSSGKAGESPETIQVGTDLLLDLFDTVIQPARDLCVRSPQSISCNWRHPASLSEQLPDPQSFHCDKAMYWATWTITCRPNKLHIYMIYIIYNIYII